MGLRVIDTKGVRCEIVIPWAQVTSRGNRLRLKRDEAAVIGGQGSRHDHRQTFPNE
jgi:hypothetical protein